ncbi:unnamed protein product [Prunus armeniaca]
MGLGPEHPGRVRGVGARISTRQYFNLPRQQRVKFADQVKESVRDVLREETLKMEARSREETLKIEARTKQLVEAERENLLNQLQQPIPNFDLSVLKLTTIQGPEQSPKNPMSDKASCSGALDVKALNFEDDNAKDGEKQPKMKSKDAEKQDEMKDKCLDVSEKEQQVPDYSKLVLSSSLQALCRYMETTLKVHEKTITQFATMDEIGATMVAVYMSQLTSKDRWGTDFLYALQSKFENGKDEAPYPQEAIEEVKKEWADFVCLHME